MRVILCGVKGERLHEDNMHTDNIVPDVISWQDRLFIRDGSSSTDSVEFRYSIAETVVYL
jgi:hypothetical protein